VHLAVVDPGVGTARRALAVRARRQLFVGPDNGILEWALSDPEAEIRTLTEERWFRRPVSRTFHGRDVFARWPHISPAARRSMPSGRASPIRRGCHARRPSRWTATSWAA
jgi:S-adenosylmethionine hydrolase